MIRVWFQDNEILIDGVTAPVVAGSLLASFDGTNVTISRIDGGSQFVFVPWPQIADVTGTGFASSDLAMAYLGTQLAMRRPVGETFGIAAVAGEDLPLAMPVAVSRSTGQLLLARSDTYTLAFVAGLVPAATGKGFAAQPAHGAVTLNDWTAVSGQASLVAGIPYFLGPSGGLTASPFSAPSACVVRVGVAASTTTLIAQPTDPILL